MKKAILFLCSFLFFSVNLFAQSKPIPWAAFWHRVQGHELAGLPKSAATVVDSIYTLAKEQENSPQLIKALLYQSKFLLTLEEDAQLKIVRNLQQEINTSSFPEKYILESVLAELYWQYYQQNRWRIYNRTHTEAKVSEGDFRTWDVQTLLNEIHAGFQRSLQSRNLSQQLALRYFDAILEREASSKTFRPTLYDFLAQNALDFYTSRESSINRPASEFRISESAFFKPFAQTRLVTQDTLSLHYNALKIYQELGHFHQQQKDSAAWLMLKLQELKFLREYAQLKNKDALYLDALEALQKAFAGQPLSTLAAFEIASVYYKQGEGFRPGGAEENRFKKQEALQICTQAVNRFPESLGARQCVTLMQAIKKEELQLTAEQFISRATPSRLLLSYQNIDAISFRIYKVSRAEQEQLSDLIRSFSDSLLLNQISQLPHVNEWQHRLRNERDYQRHQTEVVIPSMPGGIYLIMAAPAIQSEGADDLFSLAFVQVSNLALVESSGRNINRYQVMDRNSGEPVQGASVRLSTDRHFPSYNFFRPLESDKKGSVEVHRGSSSKRIQAQVSYQGDTAFFGSYYLGQYNRHTGEAEEIKLKPFLFTDRSIYRPGQKVYFKGILVKRENEKSEALSEVHVKVYAEDVNGQEVYAERLKTNRFGSFSDSFTLPTNGLTGEYTLYVEEDLEEEPKGLGADFEFDWLEHPISVEEYKRPTFEVRTEPVTGNYRLNDTISVKGEARAFAGNSLSNAKVVYTVQRRTEYPSWFYWQHSRHFYRPAATVISHGETTTDANGHYRIHFAALPDPEVEEESQPVFHYEVKADVTSLNGETRSTRSVIKVGYHSLLLEIQAPGKINKQQQQSSFFIKSTNLNGQFIPASGQVKVYKGAYPEEVQRKRPWEAPDYQDISQEKFHNLFPHDPYENEEEQIQKGQLVATIPFNTKSSEEIVLEELEEWVSGNYLMEVEGKDQWNQPVKEQQEFRVFDPDEKTVPDHQLFSIHTDKAFYRSGEDVRLQLGSAAENLHVTISVEKDHKIVETKVVALSNCKKELKIPISRRDNGDFFIHYHFSFHNYFQNGSIPVRLKDESRELEVSIRTFRDKLQPGEEQQWSFHIAGARKDRVVAEVLASMYDASLDQFKAHQWSFEPIRKELYYSSFGSNASQSFGTTHFFTRNASRAYYRPREMSFDQLDWFGFSFTGNSYINQRYLRRIELSQLYSSSHSSNDTKVKEGMVYGTVAGRDGVPLPGVTVRVNGTRRGVTTDFDGSYGIEAKAGETLIFSFVGFEPFRVLLEKHNVVDVILLEDVKQLQEVVVSGMATKGERSYTEEIMFEEVPAELVGRVAGIKSSAPVRIRGASAINGKAPLYIVDGLPVEQFDVNSADLLDMQVLKGASATALYGARAANGVVIINTKAGQEALDAQLAKISTRQNLQETAFFYPHLQTDQKGNVSFTFTAPEALTRWKLQLLAHNQELSSTVKTLQTLTQKELMVRPNSPRFLREGDKIEFAATVHNLGKAAQNGIASLQLSDAISGASLDEELANRIRSKRFEIGPNGSTKLSWVLEIPEGIQALQYKIVAKAGNFSDGEQNVLPVLSNRMLVTETLPIWVGSGQSKTFTLDKLKHNASTTLEHHQLSLEMTANPVWYAVQALPYLMEYPYECAEQTFARYYAHVLAIHLLEANPRIKEVFEQWKASGALESALLKNEELKSLLVQETPWLQDAFAETAQKKRLASFFDTKMLQQKGQVSIQKLAKMQLINGGFPWFEGSKHPNRTITLHIASGFGHLKHLKALPPDAELRRMLEKTLHYLDQEVLEDYQKLQQNYAEEVGSTQKNGSQELERMAHELINPFHIHYLYMRSFYPEYEPGAALLEAINFYQEQASLSWKEVNLSLQSMVALSAYRNGNEAVSQAILQSLQERSINNDESGMYWKANQAGWGWYKAPVETQALLVEAFAEIKVPDMTPTEKVEILNRLKVWLLKHKQSRQWNTTKATTEAVYALLQQGSKWQEVSSSVDVWLGGEPVQVKQGGVEAGTGYFKTSWSGLEVKPEMSEVKITKEGEGVAWGALYWQYFEELDQITPAETPLKLSKKLFLKTNTDAGEKILEIAPGTTVQIGDLLRVRIEVEVDRDMDFIHMKDMRASGLEPVNVRSSYKWQDGLGYYESTRDASTNFFFDYLPKGIYVFEYDVRVNNQGDFSNGITSIQSMYAPEFSSHSEGVRVQVQE